MPIYEYRCRKCGAEFELLVREATNIACEACGSKQADKLMSTFAAQAGGAEKPPACAEGCPGGFERGACGSGCCGLE